MGNKLTLQTIFSAVDKLSGPVKTMEGKTKHSTEGMKSSFEKLKKTAEVAVAALTAGEAAKAIGEFAERGDEVARNAKILGLSAEAYQELSYAAKQADVDQETFASSAKKFSKNLGEMNLKEGSLYTTLAKVNPSLAIQMHHAKSTDEALSYMADAIAKETNAQKKAVLATAAFGKTGADLIPMMDNLAEARKKAHNAGAIMSEKEVESAERMEDATKGIKAAGMGLLNSALAPIAEKLAPIVERTTAWINANHDLINMRIDQGIGLITGAATILISAWDSGLIPATLAGIAAYKTLTITMAALPAIIGAVKTVTFALAAVQGGAATAAEAFNLVLAANPVGLVCIAIAALVGIIALMVIHWKTVGPVLANVGQSFLKWILTPVNLVMSAIQSLLTLYSKIPLIGSKFGDAAKGMKGFQDKMNMTLTGSAGTFDYAGVWNDGKNQTPVSSNTTTTNRSQLDVNFNSLPAGTTTRQSGSAPGITLNMGRQMTGGAR